MKPINIKAIYKRGSKATCGTFEHESMVATRDIKRIQSAAKKSTYKYIGHSPSRSGKSKVWLSPRFAPKF
jgi:Cu/Ag efflux protein CusF